MVLISPITRVSASSTLTGAGGVNFDDLRITSFEDDEHQGSPSSRKVDPLAPAKKKKSKKVMQKPKSLFSRQAPTLYPPSSGGKRERRTPANTRRGRNPQTKEERRRSQIRSDSAVRSLSPDRTPITRNLKISEAAKRRNAELQQDDDWLSNRSGHNELADLKTIITQLKKVELPDISKVNRNNKGRDKSDVQASEIMEILRNLRRVEHTRNNETAGNCDVLCATVAELKKAGYIADSRVTGTEDKILEGAQLRLEKVQRGVDDDDVYDELSVIVGKLRKVKSPKVDSVGILDNTISKLKELVPKLKSGRAETNSVLLDLQRVASGMHEREAGELAGVIRSFDDDQSKTSQCGGPEGELARVIANLKSLCSIPAPGRKDLFLGENLSNEDADILASAIARLKRAKMTNQQATECAEVIRILGRASASEGCDFSEGDELRSAFLLSVKSVEKRKEIQDVLKGLRNLNLSDRDLNGLADRIASLRRDSIVSTPPEIADVIARLRRAKMNKKQAKEIATIVFNLRKTPRDQFCSPEEDEREKVQLRKVLPTLDESNSDELFSLVWNLRDVDFDNDGLTYLGTCISSLGEDDMSEEAPSEIDELPVLSPVVEDTDETAASGEAKELEQVQQTATEDEEPVLLAREQVLKPEDSIGEEANNQEPLSSEEEAVPAAAGEDTKEPEPCGGAGNDKKKKKKLNLRYSCPENWELAAEREDKHKKIIFTQKPRWIHKKHNATLIGEKRWRFEEGCNADEVVFSRLTKDQHARRKKVSASIFANLDDESLLASSEHMVAADKLDGTERAARRSSN